MQALCPVCREKINCDVDSLIGAPPPIDVEAATDFAVTQELLEMQRKMAELYLRQQQRGGIIDLEAEGIKMLLTTENGTDHPNPPGTSLNAIANSHQSSHVVIIKCVFISLIFFFTEYLKF